MEPTLLIRLSRQECIETVRRNAPLTSDDEAHDVAVATLRTLGERVTDGGVEGCAARFPTSSRTP